jgi:hypothetical protein
MSPLTFAQLFLHHEMSAVTFQGCITTFPLQSTVNPPQKFNEEGATG